MTAPTIDQRTAQRLYRTLKRLSDRLDEVSMCLDIETAMCTNGISRAREEAYALIAKVEQVKP